MDVLLGGPVYRQGTYVIDKFLANQRDIQLAYPSCELVLATNEADLVEELRQLLVSWGLKGKVIPYETVKPENARGRVWNIACGREAIRQHMLSQTEADYYLSVDADMVYDPAIVEIMKSEIQGYDVIFSGCPYRDGMVGLTGSGCMMARREALQSLKFRCAEFKSGDVLSEDNMFEMDSFRRGSKIKKGFFLHVSHYKDANEALHIAPQPVGTYRRIATSALVRYLLIRASLTAGVNLPGRLWRAKARAARGLRFGRD